MAKIVSRRMSHGSRDSYGDFIRHYLPAIATDPQFTANEDHILASTSVIQQADYKGNLKKFLVPDFDKVDTNKVIMYYRAYDENGIEIIRLKNKPSGV